MKYVLLFYLFLLTGASLCAQQKEFIFKNFTQDDGLPSNETYYSFEDSKHFLWFATDNGVVRYNGNRIEVFETPDKTVFQIREDSKGRVWFFTYKAQFAYYEKGKMQPYQFNNILKKRLLNLHVKDVYIDSSDNIYLSSTIDSNFVIDNNGNITATAHYKNDNATVHFEIDVLKNNTCFTKFLHRSFSGSEPDITLVKNNRKINYHIPLLVLNNSQYGSISPDGKTVYFFYGDMIVKLMDDGTFVFRKMPFTVSCLKYHKGFLYAGLINEGLYVLDEKKFPAETSRHFKGRSISSVLFDYEDGLWLTSTDKGIFYVKNQLLRHIITDKENQSDISFACNFNDSTLLYANHDGFFTLTKSRNELFIKEKNSTVINIIRYKKNMLVCSGGFSGFYTKVAYNLPLGIKRCMFHNNPILYTHIYNDYIVGPTTLYVAKYKSAPLAYDTYNKTYDSGISPLKILLPNTAKTFMGKEGIIWAGVHNGLYKSVPPYDTLLLENNSPLLNKGINFIAPLQGSILAISTQAGTIVLMDKDIIGTIEEKDGLLSNKIRFLLPLKNQLWVATQLGISVIEFSSYTPLKYTIRNIDKKDGLFNVIINHLLEHNGDVIAATSNGLYYIENPGILLKQVERPIPFSISNINYYKGDVSDVSSITLPYSKNRAIIKYRAVCFNSFESVQYRYRFTSGDTVWHNTTSNELVLENLEPGNYGLEVKAVIPSQQRTSEVQTLSILVEKPWWQSNWFRLFAAILVTSVIYFLVSGRIKKVKAEEKRKTDLNAKLSELEQTALRSQMNPHFIFNCLTSIQQLIISGNKVDANEYLVKFSRLIRKTLDMSARPFISIAEETKYLEEYLFLEQLRLSGRFDFSITSDPSINTNTTFIPNMMIQPVVENCV
ncbi:MAG: histidine kinase, partial [Bacteroidota bacterium]